MQCTQGGNRFIVTAQDSVSKWVEAGPIPNNQAVTVMEWLWQNVIARYGCPKGLVMDNEREFLGECARRQLG